MSDKKTETIMKLESLIQAIPVKQISGNTNKEISGLDSDSRNIQQDFLFVAVKGTAVDGHQFIDKAIESGATAIVCEEMPENITPTTTYIQVSDSKEALGLLASEWYANPSRQLTLVGVTGTNGKTLRHCYTRCSAYSEKKQVCSRPFAII